MEPSRNPLEGPKRRIFQKELWRVSESMSTLSRSASNEGPTVSSYYIWLRVWGCRVQGIKDPIVQGLLAGFFIHFPSFLWGPFNTLLVLCFQWVHRFNFSVIQCIGLNLKAVGCLCCKFLATFNPRHFMKPNIGAWIITILFLRVPCYDYTKTHSKSHAIK